ncbi:MAG: RDD family protein [Sulfurimonas sp.]|uniref:RDD family protein n=1 Tax=Sulfurimonas sp. TaxID=2022749 RepID=UPI00261DF9E6|nr:RDD family protein [Sulfurimonas sp.]MCW8894895.1 RDD family protein [Sulfurimonas sp.]MCW8953812.1 RDD family protein [Sulfurimonas sp.]
MQKTKEYDKTKVEYASFIARWIAFTIDNALFAIFTIILIFPFPDFENSFNVGLYRIFTTLILIFLMITFWVKFDGATPGKKIMKIKIVDADTLQTIDYKQGTIRFLGYILSSIIFLFGFLMVIFRKRKQGLHDIVSNTIVVNSDSLVALEQ